MTFNDLSKEQQALVSEGAKALMDKANRNKVYGSEGLEVGDIFTITPFNGELISDGLFGDNQYLRISCTGDRSTISVSALFGSSKPRKYFANAGYDPEFAEGYDAARALAEAWVPEVRNEREVVPYICASLNGTTFQCIASCEHVEKIRQKEETLHTYLFKVVTDNK